VAEAAWLIRAHRTEAIIPRVVFACRTETKRGVTLPCATDADLLPPPLPLLLLLIAT